MQPPGSPGTSATKVVFKNKGNAAAVRLGDIFEIQNSIEFGKKIMIFFWPNLNVRNERKINTETTKVQTTAEKRYKTAKGKGRAEP